MLEMLTASQAACRLTEGHISAGRVQAMHATAGFGLVQGSAKGVIIKDLDGNSYIDCRSAGGVFNLGHRNPEIANVLISAIEETDMGDWMLLSGIRANAAQKMAEAAPGELEFVQFTVTGSEAVETACKFARGATGRQKIIAMEQAYHGFSGFPLATAPASLTSFYQPLTPGIVQVPFGDIEAIKDAIDDNTAAVLLETVQGSAGVLLPPDGYLRELRALCDDRDVLLVFDEVQAGMGRTGKLFSFEHWDVIPDMVAVAKALGGGYYPISACIYNHRVADFVNEHPLAHPSTFSGSELGCLVAAKALELLGSRELLDNVEARGKQLADGYGQLQEKYPQVVLGHRQIGLFTGIETPTAETGKALRHAAVRHGLIAFTAPFRPQFLQVWPPLIITRSEVEELLLRLGHAIHEASEGA
jgi:putrescine aminotransferase